MRRPHLIPTLVTATVASSSVLLLVPALAGPALAAPTSQSAATSGPAQARSALVTGTDIRVAGPQALRDMQGIGVVLDQATIPQLQQLMGAKRLTSATLTAAYLYRIYSIDPKVNAVIRVDASALAQARTSDARRRKGRSLGPMDGIPVLLKDNVDTKDMVTTAGSRALLGSLTPDATLTRKLRAAGAVILGKANLSEWANFRDPMSTSGWSGVGGLTHNPYVLDRNACGSSSGSAAGVAASLAQVAIGTETDGSIVCPSGTNGVVGIKPTLGLVSRSGVVPISAQQDTAGPIARHVVDAAIMLSVIQGKDPQDAATNAIPKNQPTSYTLNGLSLWGARIGVWRQAGQDKQVDAIVNASVRSMRAAGATVVDVSIDPSPVYADETTALNAEFKRDINSYLAKTGGEHPQTLAGLIAFDKKDPIELKYFGQQTFLDAQASPPASSAVIQAARSRATSRARAMIDRVLKTKHLNAIVSPTNGPAWVTTLGKGDNFTGPSSSTPSAVSGYPDVTVPAGFDGPLPIGLSFIGTRWSDPQMVSLAYGFEQTTRARRAPRYLPSLSTPSAGRPSTTSGLSASALTAWIGRS